MPQKAVLLLMVAVFPACHILHYPAHWTPDAEPERDTAAIDRVPPAPASPEEVTEGPELPARMAVSYARAHLGAGKPLKARGRTFRFDCSGFVRAAYYQAGIDLFAIRHAREGMSGTEMIYQYALETGGVFAHAPRPGDLVFFHNTYDRNRNGRLDDEFTHVGIVEKVAPTGTVTIIHLGNAGVGRIQMTLSKPRTYRDPRTGEILNHKLRRQRHSDPARTRYLTAQLFHAYGRPYPG